MPVSGFGINIDAGRIDGDLDMMEQDLEYYRQLGFDSVEIPVHGIGALLGGHLVEGVVREAQAMLRRFPFRYTVHGPNPANLMNTGHIATEKAMMQAAITFAGAIGAPVVVYHAGRFLPEEDFLIPDQGAELTPAQKEEMLRVEREALQELAGAAAREGVALAVENARPFTDTAAYCYGEWPARLAEQVRQVGCANVGITLDLGHAYLAARHYGFDFLDAVASVAPLVKHIHVHDNFGRTCGSYEKKQYELVAAGRGDLHLPVGWGEVPVREALGILAPYYSGVFTQEIRPRYRKHFAQALAAARGMTDSVCTAQDTCSGMVTGVTADHNVFTKS